MGSDFTVFQSAAAGSNTVTIPIAGATLIGVLGSGIYYISIPIDATRDAIIPMASIGGGNVYGVVPVTSTIKGQTFTYTVANAGEVVFYFGSGTPIAGQTTRPLSAYSGVVTSTTTVTAGTAVSNTVNLPTTVQITAVGVISEISTGATAVVQFTPGAGFTFTAMSFSNTVGGQPLMQLVNNISAATTMAISVTSYTNVGVVLFIVWYQ